MTSAIPSPIPHGRTARRLEWPHLPPSVRTSIEHRCGSPVVEADSQGAGFTPGFASVLTCADGSRHFVKAASNAAQRMFGRLIAVDGRIFGGADKMGIGVGIAHRHIQCSSAPLTQ